MMNHLFVRLGMILAVALWSGHAGALAQSKGAGETVGAGIYRFHAAGVDAKSFPPSIAVSKVVVGNEGTEGTKIAPVFSRSADGLYCVHVETASGTSLYGTGEIAGPLLRNGRSTICWNTDAYAYTEANVSLYQSHPWVLAVREDGSSFGVLADTTWKCEIDLKEGITFRGYGAPYWVYVIDRASPQEVVKGLAELTGTMPLPPKWALGYHQCRYSYNPEARVREIAAGFRGRKIPCDVIWFDIDYMDGYRVFTFDSSQFPDPKRLNADLGEMGFRRIWMIDPGVKAEPGYFVHDQMIAAAYPVMTPGGEVYKGEVWPGKCVFPDYTRPEVRTWWAGLFADFMAAGVSGVWNDMNEPAVFNVASKTMPEDNVHGGGAWNGGTQPLGSHLQYHNVYGTLMAMGTYEGIAKALPDKRPFVLTRAGYLGSHRYAATWTGDNSAEWDDLEASAPMVLNLGLSGQPFCGPDIGGFNGNGPDGAGGGEGNGKLFARWMGFGSLLPFARGHTGKGNINKEPWAFGPAVERTCKLALERRYRLLPYLYTLFREASVSGLPVARPVLFADPKDPALRTEDDCFLLGDDLLVVCQMTPSRARAVALPRNEGGTTWKRVEIVGPSAPGPAIADADLPELLVRPGAIVPIGPVIEHVDQQTTEPLELLVNLDASGKATGQLYEDAGDGFGYRDGQYLLSRYAARRDGDSVVVTVSGVEGKLRRPERIIVVNVLDAEGRIQRGRGKDGGEVRVEVGAR